MISTEHFINRELSWLEFNSRVLEEADSPDNPLLERLKFIAIFGSNLDEFFMVRVAGLRQQLESGSAGTDPSGLNVQDQLDRIRTRVVKLVSRQYRCLRNDIFPGLRKHGVELLTADELNMSERQTLTQHFKRQILPVLTPVAVDPSHPFPILSNGAIEIIVSLRSPREQQILNALVEVPGVLSRFIEVRGHVGDEADRCRAYMLLEDLILANLPLLFNECEILNAFPFRVTRDMDFEVDKEGVADLLAHLEQQLKVRRRREPIRLEAPRHAPPRMVSWLIAQLGLTEAFMYRIDGPLNLADYAELLDKEHDSRLTEPSWVPLDPPEIPADKPVFEAIRERHAIPIFLPFESFDPVVRFLEEAADDPDVLTIKQTLYRVSGDSPVVRSLQRAAENGKQVTVIVEVKARFDEERNIAWARRLEESGAHVIYGIVGLKIHCKALLIIRREEGHIRRYLHLSTGNYNDRTARQYTDIGMLLDDPGLCNDIAALFNVMTGYAEPPRWAALAVAPFNLRERFLELIDREARLSTPHHPGRITAKLNSLVDPEVIEHLYAAARSGVRIDLIVRGICCLNPGRDTDNINVISIIDRYLEHSRVYRFNNGGAPEYYLSSADWMPRNLDRRIETLWPVHDETTQTLIDKVLDLELGDKVKGRLLAAGGAYRRRRGTGGTHSTRSQHRIYEVFTEHCTRGRPAADPTLQVIRRPERKR